MTLAKYIEIREDVEKHFKQEQDDILNYAVLRSRICEKPRAEILFELRESYSLQINALNQELGFFKLIAFHFLRGTKWLTLSNTATL